MAETIARTHEPAPPTIALTVGDNFYPSGVWGLRDPQWDTTFRDVYQGEFWNGVVFRPTFGNHDHLGNTDAQIHFSRLEPRWQMPDSAYAFMEELPDGGQVLFVALDTDQFFDDSTHALHTEWLDSVAEAGREEGADWIVAYGHHPIETVGRHGPSSETAGVLIPAMREHGVLYLAGHNHSTELLEPEPGLFTAVCGGGAGTDNDYWVGRSPTLIAAFSGGGWCFLRIWRDALAIELYDAQGTLRYREVLRPEEDSE
jgi:acid phosphatase